MKKVLTVAFLFCSGLLLPDTIAPQVAPVKKVMYPNLDLVYRAAKAIEAATSVGVSYAKFGDLLQNLATEIAIAEDKVTIAREKTLLLRYKLVLDAYKFSHDAWTAHIKESTARDNSRTVDIWTLASKALRNANAYYLNDTKAIAEIESEEKARAAAEAKAEAQAKVEAAARAAKDAKELAAWPQTVDNYIQGLPAEQRESVKKECLALGPFAEVWLRQGDAHYHYGVRQCQGIPENEKASYVRDAHQVELREAIKRATRCPLCGWPIKK